MKIDPSQVRHLAKLAWLELSDAEIEKYAKDLSAILDYVDQLNVLDTKTVQPTYHVMKHLKPGRQDEVRPSLNLDTFLENVPQHQEGAIQVPKIIEIT